MATVQASVLRLQLISDPTTKTGQGFQGTSAAVTITGAADNGSGLIRITAANHGFVTGNQVYIIGVTGTTEANNTASNPNWTVTRISSSTFDLQGSTFSNAYSANGTATGALVGSVDGDKFPRQRILDIYNEARFVLFGALRSVYPTDELVKLITGTIVNNTSFTFSSGSATKPTGYIQGISLADSSNVPIYILPSTMASVVAAGANPHFTESATNRYVFDEGTTLVSVSGSTYVANGSSYKLRYLGITTYTLSDVLGNSTTESFNEDLIGFVVEIGNAIANEAGNQAVMALAQSLVGRK